jgi:hypothetical protein
VQIDFTEQNSGIGGWTGQNPKTGCETVTFNDENLNNNTALDSAQRWGATVAHEGQHLVDDAEGAATGYPISRMDSEVNAYTNQAYFQRAIGYSATSTDIWTNSVGINWSMIQMRAALSTGNTR